MIEESSSEPLKPRSDKRTTETQRRVEKAENRFPSCTSVANNSQLSNSQLTTDVKACKHCELTVEQVQAEMVSNHALKAAETAALVAGGRRLGLLRPVKHSQNKACANVLVSVATLTTCSSASAQSPGVFHAGESDIGHEETSECVPEGFPSEDIGEQDRDALGRIEEEITEMDTVGFDDTHALHESVDMQCKSDARCLEESISVESAPLLPIFERARPKKVIWCAKCRNTLKNG
jgi:hypothetical protein